MGGLWASRTIHHQLYVLSLAKILDVLTLEAAPLLNFILTKGETLRHYNGGRRRLRALAAYMLRLF